MRVTEEIIGRKFGPVTQEMNWKDIILYALGVGAGAEELDYVYEKELKIIPSFAVLSAFALFPEIVIKSGINIAGLLHGEHDVILHHPIPPAGAKLTSMGKIIQVYDKGAEKGALVLAEVETHSSSGLKLFTNVATIFGRLDGGFGGKSSPKEQFIYPDRPPDFVETAHPSVNQPLLYRLSGDTFPLHIDPDFARASGFENPIMHGLCTHGYACRGVVKHLFPGEPERMLRFRTRFSKPLYPGVPIQTQIWKIQEGTAHFKTINEETGEIVLDRGTVEWH